MTDHEKRRLTRPVILSNTRYIGFSQTPLTDQSPALISGTPEPDSDYKLLNGRRFIDCKHDTGKET